jgi:hypothetical protein
LTRDVTGQFVTTAGGPVKLFAWNAPQSTTPADALRLHASDVRSLLVRAAAVDAPGAYQLLDLGRGGAVPLRVQKAAPQQLVLAPGRALHAAGALRLRCDPRGHVRRARFRLPRHRCCI